MSQFLMAHGPRLAVTQTIALVILSAGFVSRHDLFDFSSLIANATFAGASAQTMPMAPPITADAKPDASVARAPLKLPDLDRPRTRSDIGAATQRERDGHFYFDTVADGVHLRMMFDTGATLVSLRAEDAARAGINVSRLNYSKTALTANGVAEVAMVTIASLTVGTITLRNVVVQVAKPGKLNFNLLGQSFLGRVAGYSVEGNRLVLRGGK